MLPHLSPFTWESKGTNYSVGWLFCQESACTAPRCAIAEWLAIATTLPAIQPRIIFTLHPNVMQASISGFGPCQTRCSSIKAQSRRSSMLVVLPTRLSRELQAQWPTPRLAVTHSRPDQGETGSLLPERQVQKQGLEPTLIVEY